MPSVRNAGFTLIEALVALVLLSAAVAGFYDVLSTSVNAARRAEQAALSIDRRRNALELAVAINPMETPDGAFDMGGYSILWRSTLLEGPRQSSRYPSGKGIFNVALYKLILSFSDDPSIAPIELTQLGYRRDRVLGQAPGGSGN